MNISASDISAVEDVLRQCVGYNTFARHERDSAISYLAARPHLLFPLGYDEARVYSKSDPLAWKDVSAILQRAERGRQIKSTPFKGPGEHEAILRHAGTGEWHLLYYLWGSDPFRTEDPLELGLVDPDGNDRVFLVEDYLRRLRDDARGFDDRVVFNQLWVPPTIDRSEIVASVVSLSIIHRLQQEHVSLKTLSWRQLEELVAELLMIHGLEVELTPRTRDGGRDIIARGELFPGLRAVMAVEVTKTETVGIAKLAQARYRNRHFPLVMLATSGRFSAGVVREQSLPENHMRLLLRDGDALCEWINRSLALDNPGAKC